MNERRSKVKESNEKNETTFKKLKLRIINLFIEIRVYFNQITNFFVFLVCLSKLLFLKNNFLFILRNKTNLICFFKKYLYKNIFFFFF